LRGDDTNASLGQAELGRPHPGFQRERVEKHEGLIAQGAIDAGLRQRFEIAKTSDAHRLMVGGAQDRLSAGPGRSCKQRDQAHPLVFPQFTHL
jgi:hypothetical protein